MLRSPLNLCAWLQTRILLLSHHQTLSRAVFTGSGVLFVPLLVAEHAFRNVFQCSGSASGLWSTDVSPTPAVTHSSPPFQTKDDFRPFVARWLFSLPKSLSLGHSQFHAQMHSLLLAILEALWSVSYHLPKPPCPHQFMPLNLTDIYGSLSAVAL